MTGGRNLKKSIITIHRNAIRHWKYALKCEKAREKDKAK